MSSNKSSSSSVKSQRFFSPMEIQMIMNRKLSKKDLFERLLEEFSDCKEQTNNQQEQKLIDEMGLSPRNAQGCKCSKIDCLKLYCQCFAKGKLCNSNCSCTSCKNCSENQCEIYKAKQLANLRHPDFFEGIPSLPQARKCTCKKSLCQKKYCQCFNAGLKCTEQCECISCHNARPHISIDSRMQIQVNA